MSGGKSVFWRRPRALSVPRGRGGSCHGPDDSPAAAARRVLMVGNPNVGKSALFNRMTGSYAVVSNYPGTTVAVSSGVMRSARVEYRVVDTPGMYSLLPITEEERVGRKILLEEDQDAVLHVVDAKNLARMLPLTLQLIEAGLPVVLVLNIMDEAREAGVDIDVNALEKRLGIPVIPTISVSGKGIRRVREAVSGCPPRRGLHVDYGPAIEKAVHEISPFMPKTAMSARSLALLALQEDPDVLAEAAHADSMRAERVLSAINRLKRELDRPVGFNLTMERQRRAEHILSGVLSQGPARVRGFASRLDGILVNPLTGLPVLALVLYLGFFKFVGGFGAGTLVDFLEGRLFEGILVPFFNRWTEALVPWPVLQDLIAKDYGVLTMGFRYAVAIVMPIVGAYFLVFSVVEDSGYLPRLSLLVDRVFKRVGLSGRAVIPMTLGFGCGTMATMVTRTLETKRERVIATILLALAIPCSAQLGVILGLAAGRPGILVVWAGTVLVVFLLAGHLLARALPGKEPDFFMELPPLRLPRLANIWIKTSMRMRWYFLEILPLFLLASVIIWAGTITGLFEAALRLLAVPTRALGLPDEAARAFLFGFFRRDYGVAGLYDVQRAGGLTGNQLTVATITLTLFLPCIAQFLVMLRERGTKMALAVAAFVFPFAFFVGWVVNALLNAFGIEL